LESVGAGVSELIMLIYWMICGDELQEARTKKSGKAKVRQGLIGQAWDPTDVARGTLAVASCGKLL